MKVLSGFVLVAGSLVGSAALASGYPADYCHQVVRATHDGPVLFAHVGSGCESLEIIGYKNSGILAAEAPEAIDAVIVATCHENGTMHTRTSVVRLGREWHGTGYMSAPMHFSDFVPNVHECYGKSKVSFAFSANGKWDSRDGQNYGHFGFGFYNDSREVVTHQTHQVGYGSVNLSAWDFIVGQMGR